MKYNIVAKIDKEAQLVFTFDDTINLDKYKDMNNLVCEYCQTKRNRKYFYIVSDENGILSQHGSSCIVKFINFKNLTELEKRIIEIDDFLEFNSYKNTIIWVEEFITKLILIQENVKFNKDTILNFINSFKITNYSIKQIDDAKRKTLDVIKHYTNIDSTNEFITNVKKLVVGDEYFNIKYINIMKWSYQLYLNYIEKQTSKATSLQEEIENGTRIKFNLVKIEYKGYSSYPFYYNKYEIIDDLNKKYIYNTSKELNLDNFKKEVSAKIHIIQKNGIIKIKDLRNI